MMRVGFVGAGDMGLRLIARLVQGGHQVITYDLRAPALARAVEAGSQAASNISELVEGTDAVALAVVNDKQVRDILDGPDGLLRKIRPPQTVIVHSTVQPETIQTLAKTAAALGISLIDAPVAGAGIRADAGQLAVLVGGEPDVISRCSSILSALGNVNHVGPAGAGQAVKLANNMVVAAAKSVIYEAFSMTRAFGIDDETVRNCLIQGSANSFVLEHWSFFEGLLLNHTLADSADFFSFMTKDIWSAVMAGHSKDVDMPVAAVAASTLAETLRCRARQMRGPEGL